MSQDPTQALTKRSSSDVSLMPPPPFKRIKRPSTVLDEDQYTAALSEIIARDYFPGLLESQAQHEYLAALESDNDAWIAEAAKKLREAAMPTSSKRRGARNTRFNATPSATPLSHRQVGVSDTPLGYNGNDTPMTTASGSQVSEFSEPSKTGLDTSTLTLAKFQAKYTSEDNESFNTVLDKQNQKRREKNAHLWSQDQRIPSARQIAHRAREARLLTQKQDAEAAGTGNALVPMTFGATDQRPAQPDAWKIKRPDNAFMFNTESVDEDGMQTVMDVKEQNSKIGPRHVVHANTRFPSAAMYREDPGPIPPSPSLNTDIIARRDARRAQRDGAHSSSLSETDCRTDSEYNGASTPRVNGYTFVEEDEPENLAPQINPTSVSQGPSYRDLLAGQTGDGTPNPFKINEIRKREDLHLRMVEKQARAKREKGRETERGRLLDHDHADGDSKSSIFSTSTSKTPSRGGSGVGNWTPGTILPASTSTSTSSSFTGKGSSKHSNAIGNMTPAARRLMEKLGGGRTPMHRGSAGAGAGGERDRELAGRDMWTPTTRTPSGGGGGGRTPRRSRVAK